VSLYLIFHSIRYIGSNDLSFCCHISLTTKLQFPIFSRDEKRPEIRFGFDVVPVEYPVVAVPMDPCEGPQQGMTCTADTRCYLCGDPVSNKAMAGN
jgi:hypothetical protein